MRKEFETRTQFSKEEIDVWFDHAKPEETEDGVVWINEPHHFEDVYCYLVLGRDKDLLIDTGMGIKPITSLLNNLRDASRELIAVNTHWHFDHIGGNKEFSKVNVPDDQDEIDGIKRGWSREQLSEYFFFDGFWHASYPQSYDPSSFFIPGYTHIELLPKKIDLGNRLIEVIETPGHTPGSASFFDRVNGLLFTGDLLYEGPLYSFEKESNPSNYLDSLRKIARLKVKTIYPGHNHSQINADIIEESIGLFERALRREGSYILSQDFPNTAEYELAPGRRLKLLVPQT